MHRALVLLALVVAVTLAPATPAYAAGTERVVVARFSAPYGFDVTCPEGFTVTIAGVQYVTITEVYDRDGGLLRVEMHARYREVDERLDTGDTIDLRGAYTQTVDLGGGALRLAGQVGSSQRPGDGAVLREVGLLIVDLVTRETLFVAGPHDFLAAGGPDPALCRAFA